MPFVSIVIANLDRSVLFVPLHIDGTEWTCRTQILTRPAPDTPFGIDNRYSDRVRSFDIRRDHQYRSRRTMTGTVAALHTVGQRDAILSNPYGMPDAGG